ncbi:MAG: ABC transporter substrate-binding protein [Candidatus Bathyarchaeota archaeon]|nr:ABC transporter substrate-binding protein [Candidatus Bathyarchaeota archaeon]
MSKKEAVARTTYIFALVIIILVGSILGVVYYYSTLPPEAEPIPGEFALSDLTVAPSEVGQGQDVIVSVFIENTGDIEVTGTITLALNNVIESTKPVTLAGGANQTLSFTVITDTKSGNYAVTIPGTSLSGSFNVTTELQPPAFVLNNELIYERDSQFQWLDPHVSYFQYDYWTIWQSVETLLWFERDNATKIIPWLAESYTRGSDGLHYNFTLRQGITFQDGTKFNATAVWFSMNRLLVMDATSGDGLNHGSQAGWMLMQLIDLDGDYFTAMGADPVFDEAWVQSVLDLNFVEIIDEYKVKINLATATTQFLPIMAGPWAGIVNPVEAINKEYEFQEWDIAEQTPSFDYTKYFVHMAGLGETYFTVPTDGWRLGTGPYYIESVVGAPTYRIVLLAYDNYWGGPDNMNLPPAGKERIGKITFRYQSSFATRLLNLKAGAVTGIYVPEVNIFSVVDRDRWLDDGDLESIVDGAVVHGVFPTFNTWWLDFCTNITNPDGSLKSWQPFADWRLRAAAACAINITEASITVNNRLAISANNIVPPGTAPQGSYNPNITPAFSFNLTKDGRTIEELIQDAYENPLNSADYDMYYYNGTQIPAGVVDNAFSTGAGEKVIQFYVQSGADTYIKVLSTMADTLNGISNQWGLRWQVVLVPSGQQYTLASAHKIDSYVGGWVADYNNIMNWLQPMYYSRGTYPSWNRWNITALDDLYAQAVAADEAGNETLLLEINDQMNTISNEAIQYMVWWHDTDFFTRSTWLKGWYLNVVYDVDLWSTMYYEQP